MKLRKYSHFVTWEIRRYTRWMVQGEYEDQIAMAKGIGSEKGILMSNIDLKIRQ